MYLSEQGHGQNHAEGVHLKRPKGGQRKRQEDFRMAKMTSRPGLFGETNYYDERGRKVGESRPGLFGGTNYYDESGRKVGNSSPGLFGGNTFYNDNGHKAGSSYTGLFGGTTYYDEHGHKVAESTDYLEIGSPSTIRKSKSRSGGGVSAEAQTLLFYIQKRKALLLIKQREPKLYPRREATFLYHSILREVRDYNAFARFC